MKLKYYSGAQVISILEKLPSKEYLEMLNAFAKEPSADVAQVVRCKDCKHSVKHQLGYGCEMNYHLATNGEWFCADGERRDDVEETD